MKRVIVDESVSDAGLIRFKWFAKEKGLVIGDYLLVRELYPGMPDGQIIFHLLNSATLFITSDRPLHNLILSKGLESYYLGEEIITGKACRGIKPKADISCGKKGQQIQSSYMPVGVEIRSLLLSGSPHWLKKLRTKCRRIRNYFDGLCHMQEIAVTVSWQRFDLQVLIGARIHIASNIGLKGLAANESFLAETLATEYISLGSLSYALVLPIQLMLNSIKTIVYYDSDRIEETKLLKTDSDDPPYQDFFDTLARSFEKLEFIPVAKGWHIESLRRKLEQLATSPLTNEIQQGNLADIINKFVQL